MPQPIRAYHITRNLLLSVLCGLLTYLMAASNRPLIITGIQVIDIGQSVIPLGFGLGMSIVGLCRSVARMNLALAALAFAALMSNLPFLATFLIECRDCYMTTLRR